MKIGVIGGGTMGEILARAIMEKEIVAPSQITVADVVEERRVLFRNLGAKATSVAEDLVNHDVILLCVKPQNAARVLEPLKGKLGSKTLAISIMAGVNLEYLTQIMGHRLIIRSMPNLPARIGEGVTVWHAGKDVPDHLCLITKMIFQAFGREVAVKSEDLVDAATAVSGTGPAYIFYIAENLLQAALDLHFSEDQALKLVRETFRGAMDLWVRTGDSPAELRRKVTSKGGTTHAAVTHFQQQDIAGHFREGVQQAYSRAKELAALASSPQGADS